MPIAFGALLPAARLPSARSGVSSGYTGRILWAFASFFVFSFASHANSLVIDFETAFEPFGTIRHVETTEGMFFDPAVLIDISQAPWPPLLNGAASSGTKVLISTTTGTTVINAFRPDGQGGLLPFNFNGAFFSGFFDVDRQVTVQGFTQANLDNSTNPDFTTVLSAPPSITSGAFFPFDYKDVVSINMLAAGGGESFMIDDFDFTPLPLIPDPTTFAVLLSSLVALCIRRRKGTSV